MKEILEAYRQWIINRKTTNKSFRLSDKFERDYIILLNIFIDNKAVSTIAKENNITRERVYEIKRHNVKFLYHPSFMKYITKELSIIDKDTFLDTIDTSTRKDNRHITKEIKWVII